MPFYEIPKEPKFTIDYSSRQPISVMCAFNPTGEMKPVYFGIVDLYGNRCKVQVTGIKHTKDIRGSKSFCCTYLSGAQQRECILTYCCTDHRWVLDN